MPSTLLRQKVSTVPNGEERRERIVMRSTGLIAIGSSPHFGLRLPGIGLSIQAMFHLTDHHMAYSILDPHSAELRLRAQMGYTQRMLLLYLQHRHAILITQPTLSRWLSQHGIRQLPALPPDDELEFFQNLARLGKSARTYRRNLTQWRGHIQHLRQRNASLGEILRDLGRRGILTSIRSIRRELNAL